MASTRTLQQVVNWAQSFVHLMPLTGQGSISGEPAMTIANNVLQFILAPPFAWRWNRNKVSFTTSSTANTQTYTELVSDFGWIEQATANDGVTTWELTPRLVLPDASDVGKPTHISPDSDDDQGNVTFKLFPVPPKSTQYTITVVYQKKPVIFTATTGTWSPIPDEYAYIYNAGFLAGAYENAGDVRFSVAYQKFIESLIACNEGLTDDEKSIFLTDKLFAIRQAQDAQMAVAQGRQSRGMR